MTNHILLCTKPWSFLTSLGKYLKTAKEIDDNTHCYFSAPVSICFVISDDFYHLSRPKTFVAKLKRSFIPQIIIFLLPFPQSQYPWRQSHAVIKEQRTVNLTITVAINTVAASCVSMAASQDRKYLAYEGKTTDNCGCRFPRCGLGLLCPSSEKADATSLWTPLWVTGCLCTYLQAADRQIGCRTLILHTNE